MKNVSTMVVAMVFVGTFSSCFADALQEGKTALENKMFDKAAALLEKSCEAGNPQGCYTLGSLYEKGDGVAQNKYKAVALYTQACRGGEALGCSNMAMTYDTP